MRLLVTALFAAIAAAALGSAHAAQEPPLTIRAGDGEPGYAINTFLPAHVTVPVGATVRWTFPWFEPHTVTFGVPQTGAPPASPSGTAYDGNGFVSSDLTLGPGKSFDLVFPVPGTFSYYCITHTFMTGTITVVEGSAAETQAQIDARSAAEYGGAIAELRAIAREWASLPDEQHALPDGSTEHVVRIAGATERGDTQQFFPAAVTIAEGDTVRWRSVVRTPHTATFGPFPPGLPVPGNPAVDGVSRPAASYDGTGYWNSGVIGIEWPLGPEFAMTFSKLGTYWYYCILHDTQGMVGVVTVVPKSASSPAPLPPATGAGPPDAPAPGGRPGLAVAAGAVLWLVGSAAAVITASRWRA